MTSSHILCVDPGLSTGWAKLVCGGLPPVRCEDAGIWAVDEDDDIRQVLQEFQQALVTFQPSVVVIEKYHGGAGGTLQSTVNRIIGGVEMGCLIFNVPLVQQRNAQRMPYILEAQQLCPNRSVHAKDALAHGLAYASKL